MHHLSTLIVRLCDLVEAEGRLMRAGALRFGFAIALVAVATVTALAGLAMLAWVAHRWIAAFSDPQIASLIIAVALLSAAGGLAWFARRINR